MQEASNCDRRSVGVRWACSLLVCLALAGCGDGKDFLKTYPAAGKAAFRGKPMQHARISLFTVAEDEKLKKIVPSGEVDADGTFTLTTYQYDDGAPAGEYKAIIVWPNGPEGQSESPGFIADQLQGRYSNAQTSTFRVTIKEGSNELQPFDLQ